ncbi:glutamine synthetase family protein [Brevibacterium sp. S111]|uniref:glutamine synthetase family protein n=1 Tax=Brevibacterium sp. S111 TaxID=2483795 RepID=UPI0010821EA5|nr:glutamine synthetase family protein [Brevibacterium sp. S111]TGD13803.1 glutamine synthetase [Brevibacterium sp. S111]
MSTAPSPLTLGELENEIESREIDTVLIAATDMQGRLQGKRVTGRFFLDEVRDHGTEGCNYLLAADVEMNTVDGFALTSWEHGYGDLMFVPDFSTLRRIPWHPGSAMVQCDLARTDGTPLAVSPRQVLKAQLERLEEHGLAPIGATELEFALYNTSYRDAMVGDYRNLEAASTYNIDYSLFGTGQVEEYLHRLRTEMDGAGLYTESAKGECNLGQLEVGFRYTDILATCDNHVVYKLGAKQIADQQGRSVTFMAKPNDREGSSCHIHMSLNDRDGTPVFPTGHGTEMSETMRQFVAGVVATQYDFTYLYAPNINSYKRFADGSFAPTAVGWGWDNRTCAVRIVGHGSALRFEQRVPGADANPYLACAALIAAGVYGLENRLELPEALAGNAYTQDVPSIPRRLHEAVAAFDSSATARESFGNQVVDHYVHAGEVEMAAFDAAVTDWEVRRGFERL